MRQFYFSAIVIYFMCATAIADPVVTGPNSLSHGQSITITGSGFGSKATAEPVAWDNVSGTDVTAIWDGGYPNEGTPTTYYAQYHDAPFNGVSAPHSHNTNLLAGGHNIVGDGVSNGNAVMVWKSFTLSRPMRIYGSFYHQVDPNFDCSIDDTDDNFKFYDYSCGGTPYTMNSSTDSNWYINYDANPVGGNVCQNVTETIINDDGSSLQNPDENDHNFWWDGILPVRGYWVKRELEALLTDQANGYIKVWENGTLIVDYLGSTDTYTCGGSSTRNFGLGGYARDQMGTHQWQYFTDLYFDTTSSRVLLCPGPTWANRGVCENQIPTTWGSTSIGATANVGAIAAGTAYLYVVDSAGVYNASGYAVTVGGEATPTPTPTPVPSTVSGVTMSGGSVR